MPVPAIVSAIISSIVGNIADTPPAPPASRIAALPRSLPPAAKLGEMAPAGASAVQIDGQLLQLSPAAQIRNEMNMVVMPGTIEQTKAVRYLTDATGAVWRVWILSPAELAAAR